MNSNNFIYYGNDSRYLTKKTKELEQKFLEAGNITPYYSDELTEEELLSLLTEETIFSQKLFIKISKVKTSFNISRILKNNSSHILLFALPSEKNPFGEEITREKNLEVREFNLPKPYQLEKIILSQFNNKIETSLAAFIAASLKSLVDLEDIEQKMNFYNIHFLDFSNSELVLDQKDLNLFTLVDYFFTPNVSAFIAAIDDFIEGEESLESFFGLLYKKTSDLCKIKTLLQNTKNHDSISKEIGIPLFILRKQIEIATAYSLKTLENLLIKIVQIEFQIRYYLGTFNKYFLQKLFLEKDAI